VYFIKSMESKFEESVEYGSLAGPNKTTAFIWRLLWEDTRYKDGTIPEEEKLYPTPEQSLALNKPPGENVHLRCDANEPCPRHGYWFTPAQVGSRRHFKAGELIPEFKSDYGTTIWQWDSNQQA